MEPLIGRILDGRYRMAELIGRGGMGSVYRAEHVGTGRPVAVKTILPRLVTDAQALERFRREARAAGSLRHPNIVDVTDFGVVGTDGHDIAYLVMEYLEGRTLASLLDTAGPLRLELVVEIVEQIAVALDAAHRIGIVHRDLKPDNVWLVPDRRGGYIVRVLDFGIAALLTPGATTADAAAPGAAGRAFRDDGNETAARPAAEDALTVATLEADRQDSGNTVAKPGSHGHSPGAWVGSPGGISAGQATVMPNSTPAQTERLTQSGTMLGTPAYMSPEQCRGASVDARSDVYSLGIVAWQALAGRRPFDGGAPELVRQHLDVFPARIDAVNRAVPPAVGEAIAVALAKRPEKRYASAGAMAGSLRVASEGPTAVLRRSMALYLERFSPFFRISARSAGPVLALLSLQAVLLPLTWWGIAFLDGGHDAGTLRILRSVAVLGAVALNVMLWLPLTTMHHAAFAAVVEWLRTRPLDEFDIDRVLSDVRRRIGIDGAAGLVRTNLHLMADHVKAESKGRLGQGDLAFQIAFHEGKAAGEIRDRCQALAHATKRTYDWIRLFIFATLIVPSVVEASLVFSGGLLAGLRTTDALAVAVWLASLLVPINAVLLNPGISSSLAILYFRARQALGEDVGLSAVMPSRL